MNEFCFMSVCVARMPDVQSLSVLRCMSVRSVSHIVEDVMVGGSESGRVFLF